MIKPDDWQPADGLVLEPNALAAATLPSGCLALTAGPGAGKTEMLAQRADYLLQTGLCRYPRRILAIAFKVDASKNLRERVTQRCGYQLASRFDSYTFHAMAKKIIDRFRPVLTGKNQLDRDYRIAETRIKRRQITFNDLVPLAIAILEKSTFARNAMRKTYTDVFLDEFQDCTRLQYKLIRLAFMDTETRLVAVGDTKQRIMGWAGALEGVFIQYAKDFHARALNLYRNYRSLAQLQRLQNEIIKVLDSQSAVADEAITGEGGMIDVHHYDNCHDEACAVVDMIDQWINVDGLPASEIAILVSKQPHLYLKRLMMELSNRDFVYRNEVYLQDIASEPAARLIIDYLTVIHAERAPDAYIRLMNILTPFGIDEQAQSSLRVEWQRFLHSERETMAMAKILSNDLIDESWQSVSRLLGKLGRETMIGLSQDYQQGDRLDTIINETKNTFLTLCENCNDIEKALSLFTDDQAIRIMTIHKSKGLEFDTVILLGVEEETFWGKNDEERCSFFVGISRAKAQLVLTHVNHRQKPETHHGRWEVSRTPHQEFLHFTTGLI